jgi:hypothetical protein
MGHWYSSFWDLGIYQKNKKGLEFKPSWCAGETPPSPNELDLVYRVLSGQVYCCASEKQKKSMN